MDYEKLLVAAMNRPKNALILTGTFVLLVVIAAAFAYHLLGRDLVGDLLRKQPERRQTTEVGPVTGGAGSQNSGVNSGTMVNNATK